MRNFQGLQSPIDVSRFNRQHSTGDRWQVHTYKMGKNNHVERWEANGTSWWQQAVCAGARLTPCDMSTTNGCTYLECDMKTTHARIHTHGRTDGRTDKPTDGCTDRRVHGPTQTERVVNE